jgi:hypothetical protein
MAVLAVLAFVGVKFAEKPVRWMPSAFLLVLLLLTIGITWAFHPFFRKIQKIGIRYTAESVSIIVTVMIISYVSYVIFVNLWLFFGGSI